MAAVDCRIKRKNSKKAGLLSASGIPLNRVFGYRMAMLEAPQNLPEEAADLRALLASREVDIIGFKAELRGRDLLIEKLKY